MYLQHPLQRGALHGHVILGRLASEPSPCPSLFALRPAPPVWRSSPGHLHKSVHFYCCCELVRLMAGGGVHGAPQNAEIPRISGHCPTQTCSNLCTTHRKMLEFPRFAPKNAVVPRNFVRLERLQIPAFLCTMHSWQHTQEKERKRERERKREKEKENNKERKRERRKQTKKKRRERERKQKKKKLTKGEETGLGRQRETKRRQEKKLSCNVQGRGINPVKNT